MGRFLYVLGVSLALVTLGCGQSEETKSKSGTTETATEKVAEAAKTTAGEMQEATQAVAEKTADMQKQAEAAVKEAAEESAAMAPTAKEAAQEAMSAVEEKATAAAVATTLAAGEAVESAKQAISPETIVLEASYGNVTFPHEMHAGAYDCATCHGEGEPGLFGLDKEKAHALCKSCHKQEGAGPTSCKDCHKK